MGPKTLLACLLLTAVTLGGCSGGGDEPTPSAEDLAEGAPEIEVTETTGGIRGVVVDDAIRPIKGATVEVLGTDKKIVTDETGVFAFSGLEAGTYFVKASQPLYDNAQQSVEVVAGVADPAPVKFLLNRIIFAQPFAQTLKFDGFIVCSGNYVVILSEECGEGVGSPRQTCDLGLPPPCVDNPVFPGERVGGQGNNNVQFDFTVGVGIQTVVIEQAWEPSSDAGKAFYSPVSTQWSCDPVCGGNRLIELEGESPLYGILDNATLADAEVIPDNTTISVFTWASRESTGLLLNQQYQTFVTNFYYLPAPEGWSLVNGDQIPY